MIDHVLGRPSNKSRRLQVLAVLSFWSFYLLKGHKHGLPGVRLLSKLLTRRLTAWQTVALTMMYLYAARNFSTVLGIASPEPMSNMYEADFYRATWVLTALDAGFWTAMRIRHRRLRDLASIAFSVFYLFAAEKADEKVRKVRGMITVDHLRVSWNKGKTPYLSFFQGLTRPRFTRWPPRALRIKRPPESDYSEPISAWLYYDGPLSDLQHHDKIILDIPGGGFVAMDPRCNDDKLFCWAAKTGLPVLALDYKKAPEFPYPYAINECFDAYYTIMKSKGRCIGLSGRTTPKVVITGDSAGGNLATATTLMIIERTRNPLRRRNIAIVDLPLPDGLVLFYPSLDMNIGNWMSDSQMSLIKDRQLRRMNRSVMRRKARQYDDIAGTPHHSDDEGEEPLVKPNLKVSTSSKGGTEDPSHGGPRSPHPEYSHGPPSPGAVSAKSPPPATVGGKKESAGEPTSSSSHRPQLLQTRLAVSSMISYFNDRVLTPEMMRAMIILYIGPHNRPDFSTDYLLSPVLAPDVLMEHFPKTWFLTGERDPLVDDTVIFAGRLTKVKEGVFSSRQQQHSVQLGAESEDEERKPKFDERDAAEVVLIPGISHGFLQFPTIYPPAWKHLERSAGWIQGLFAHAEELRREEEEGRSVSSTLSSTVDAPSENQVRHESSGDEDKPLEMAMTRMRSRPSPPLKRAKDPMDESRESDTDEGDDAMKPNPDMPGEQQRGGRLKAQAKRGGRGRGSATKSRSLVRLHSSEDILGRRMQGLANGLAGLADDE